MALSLQPYLLNIKKALDESLCLNYFPSPIVERHCKPEVEIGSVEHSILSPIKVSRNDNEYTLIEPAVNSCRISIKIKQIDDVERFLTNKFSKFMMQRADNFIILRRKPVMDYDLSFLIAFKHIVEMARPKIVAFVIRFMEEVDKEISEMKINVNARARFTAECWLKEFQ